MPLRTRMVRQSLLRRSSTSASFLAMPSCFLQRQTVQDSMRRAESTTKVELASPPAPHNARCVGIGIEVAT
ncbi:hypothetical protein BDV10DRAFT_38408 [Aspergillus recurvatus]